MPETHRGTHGESLYCPIELREAEDGPQIVGCLIQEGRAASARAEVFAPGSLVWSASGIALRAEHLGAEDSRAVPTREANGEIRISAARKRGPRCRVQRREKVSEHRVSFPQGNQKRCGRAGNSTGFPSGRGPR